MGHKWRLDAALSNRPSCNGGGDSQDWGISKRHEREHCWGGDTGMLKTPSSLLIALCIVCGIALLIQSTLPSPSTPHDSQQPSAADSLKGGIPVPLADASTAPYKPSGNQQHHWHDTFSEHTPEWLIAAFTA